MPLYVILKNFPGRVLEPPLRWGVFHNPWQWGPRDKVCLGPAKADYGPDYIKILQIFFVIAVKMAEQTQNIQYMLDMVHCLVELGFTGTQYLYNYILDLKCSDFSESVICLMIILYPVKVIQTSYCKMLHFSLRFVKPLFYKS